MEISPNRIIWTVIYLIFRHSSIELFFTSNKYFFKPEDVRFADTDLNNKSYSSILNCQFNPQSNLSNFAIVGKPELT